MGFLASIFLVTYNNLFDYWTIKQTKLIKRWDARPVVLVHICHDHHLWWSLQLTLAKALGLPQQQRSKQGACVQDRNLCIHPADPLLPVLWGNAWNTCTVYPSGNPKRCCSYLLPKNTEREIKRISIIYSESTLTYFYL